MDHFEKVATQRLRIQQTLKRKKLTTSKRREMWLLHELAKAWTREYALEKNIADCQRRLINSERSWSGRYHA